MLNRQKVSNSVKREAEEEIWQRPQKLIRAEMELQSNPINYISTRDVLCIRKNLNYTRLRQLSKLPGSTIEVQEVLKKTEIKTSNVQQLFTIHTFANNKLCTSSILFAKK